MSFVFGVIFLWLGGSLLYVASHGAGGATTAYDAWRHLLRRLGG